MMDLYFVSRCLSGVNTECERLLELIDNRDDEFCNTVRRVFNGLGEGSGWCTNFDKVVNNSDSECSVGMIRKDRDGVVNDDGSCYSCPLFIPGYVLRAIIDACDGVAGVDSVRGVLRRRFMELFLPRSLGGGGLD